MARLMSGMTVAILLAAPPFQASAQTLTSEQAMENYRLMTTEVSPCAVSDNPNEISVCGRRNSGNEHRLPLNEPTAGKRIRGEPISTVAAAEKGPKCSPVGREQLCGGVIPLLGIAMLLAKIVEKKVINPDD